MKTRIVLGIAVVLLCIVVSTVLADPDCAVSHCVYLPAVQYAPLPTIAPTPVPPPLNTLVIQLSEMRSGYVLDTFKEVTNADAAKNYKDPNAALKAFQQQGRESSWVAIYTSTDYAFSNALIVSSQVYRYLTIAGATQGFQYTVGKVLQDHPDYRQFNLNAPCCPIIGFRRTFTANNLTVDQFDIIVQAGRYTSEVQMIGLTGVVGPDLAVAYANIPLLHILNTPQAMHVGASSPSSPVRQRATYVVIPRDALIVH